MIPSISTEDFPLCLPPPTASNCGGYILPSASGTVYGYSPIDLCVAAFEAKRLDKIVTDLSRFFHMNPMLSMHYVYIGVSNNGALVVNSVAYFRDSCESSAMLQSNAPLTFRRVK